MNTTNKDIKELTVWAHVNKSYKLNMGLKQQKSICYSAYNL